MSKLSAAISDWRREVTQERTMASAPTSRWLDIVRGSAGGNLNLNPSLGFKPATIHPYLSLKYKVAFRF